MTVPIIEPVVVPAAPAAPVVPQAPAAAAPAEPAKPVEPAKVNNPWDDPEAAKAEITKLRQENGAARTNAKAQAAEEARNEFAQSIAKALGLSKDAEPADPAKLTEQLTASSAEARAARVELAVFRAAGSIADPVALLDSKTFLASVKDIDPTDGAALQAAIAAAVESNPRLGSASPSRLPAPNPAQGSSGSGPVAPQQLSKADVSRMYAEKDYDGIAKAQAEGRLSNLMGA
jgi:hypothetical protein